MNTPKYFITVCSTKRLSMRKYLRLEVHIFNYINIPLLFHEAGNTL